MAVLLTPPYLQFLDSNGDPLANGKVYTYTATGTLSTFKPTYTTSVGDVEHPNPVILNAAGIPTTGNGSIWIEGTYDFKVTDENDVEVETTLGVTAFTALPATSNAYFESFSGTGAQTAFTTSVDLGTDEKSIYVWIDDGLKEAVTNGTFATDTDWTKGAGWTIGSGVATATGAISTAISQTSAVTIVEGQAYSVTYTITRSAGGLIPSVGGNDGTEQTASGTYTELIIAGSTETLAFTGNAFTGTLDDVSITVASTAGFNIQNPNTYTIDGTDLTFTTAPAAGTNNIYVSAPSLLVGAASSAASDAAASAADAAADAVLTAADVVSTNADVVSTNADAVSTAADAVSTAADVVTASEWASKTTGLVAATDYSSKAWAIGGTGTTTNNAKYYFEQAAGAVTGDILPMTEQGSTPSTPATGVSKLYFKTDNNLYSVDDGGAEYRVTPDINAFADTTITASDEILFGDVDDSNNRKKDTVQGILDLTALPNGYISGLVISNGTDAEHDIDISTGSARDSTDTKNIKLTSALTKQIDANWVEGSAAGGFPSGLTLSNNTWYHVFLILKTDGTVDGGFDTSLAATNLLTDATSYSEYIRIGSVQTDGSANIIPGTYIEISGGGLECIYTDPILDVSATSVGSSAVMRTLSSPLGIKTRVTFNAYVTGLGNNTGFYMSSPDANDEAPSSTVAPLTSIGAGVNTGSFVSSFALMSIYTDTSSQIRSRAAGASMGLKISTLGYTDNRRV